MWHDPTFPRYLVPITQRTFHGNGVFGPQLKIEVERWIRDNLGESYYAVTLDRAVESCEVPLFGKNEMNNDAYFIYDEDTGHPVVMFSDQKIASLYKLFWGDSE